jgi:ABC-type uncharacterized transport system permease subunit
VERVSVAEAPEQQPEQQPEQEQVVVRQVVEPPVSMRRRVVTGSALVVAGVLAVLAFGVGADKGSAVFGLNAPADAPFDVTVPAGPTAGLLGALVVALGLYQLLRGFHRRQIRWVVTGVLVALVVAFLCWAASAGSTVELTGLLQQSIFLAIPLILGAMAGILCERSGVINVAIEGQMLTGAFAGALFGSLAQNLGVGLVAAVVAGGLMGALLAVFAIRYVVNQVILGVVLNVLALGLTGFIYDALMQPNQDSMNRSDFFSPIHIPLLGDIPIIGPLLFDANVIVYLTYAIIIVIDVALLRTRWGLRTRAVGEHPKAADTVGINVLRTRYRNVILGGCVAGLGGAFITIGAVGAFTKNISSGKGFIALAAVIFGRWSPRGALAAALLFGFADALATVLSFIQAPVAIPSNLLSMLPYLATLFAVAGLVGRVKAPAADGEPYVKG